MVGAFLMPIRMTVHSYNPQGVFTAVKLMSSGCICVWKKLLVISSVAKMLPCAMSANISFMWGIGKLSVIVFVFSWR